MRVSVAVVSAVVAALAVGAHSQSLPTCCHDLDGVEYSAPCSCLTDDATVLNQTVADGEYARFHWIMTDWSLINVPDEERPEMTVEVSPCEGDVHLLVQGPSLQSDPFPTTDAALWSATAAHSPNAITFTLTAAQYFISVYGNMSSTFSIAVQISDAAFPTPGSNGTVVAVPAQTSELLLSDDPISMDVTFITAESMHGNEDLYMYRVYSIPVVPGEPCGDDNVTSTADCILTTHCGVQNIPTAVSTEWRTFPGQGGNNVSVTVDGLTQDQEYTFTVAVRHPNGNTQMYTGTRGTPTYDRVGQAQSDSTIIAVAAGAAGLFVLLVGCIFFAKMRLNRAFQERRLARQYKNIAPTAEDAEKEARAARGAGSGTGAAETKPVPK